jgi:hypothetical protein
MNETEIRERLAELAADAPKAVAAPPRLLDRARRRVVLTLASSVAIALVVVGVAIAGVHALDRTAGRPADEPSIAPSGDLFANVHGWIAYREGADIVAVDPANPAHTLRLGPSFESDPMNWDPIAWSEDGTRLLLRGVGPSTRHESNLVILSSSHSPSTVRGAWYAPWERWVSVHATWGSFSPDGDEIVYAIEGAFPGPFIIDANGGTPRSLGDPRAVGQPFVESAAWSPDGSRIAWIDSCEEACSAHDMMNGNYFLSFVNPDGTGLQMEAAILPSGGWNLVWSPDGSRLAYSDWNFFGGPPGQIFVINADGSGLRQITSTGDNRWPTWSPDGSRIAFVRFPGVNAPEGTLYTMAPDGTDVQEVEGVHPDGAIAWNPVGGRTS